MQNITIQDIESLAKHIPSNGILIHTLQHHPNIDFESVVVAGDDLEFEDPRINRLDLG